MSTESSQPKKAPERVKSADFVSRYANNINFEGSAWDLKLSFGVLDQTIGDGAVLVQSSVNIPWAYAKVSAYYLLVNVVLQELFQQKTIDVPSGVVPTPVENFFPELDATQHGHEALKMLRDVHIGLFGHRDDQDVEAPEAPENTE